MKLLSKTEISTQKSLERKVEIDQGAMIARKVDKLRETYSDEEKKLNDFRTKSIEIIKSQIKEEDDKRLELVATNEELKKANEILRKPLDEEWLMLEKSKLDYENKVNLFEEEQKAHKLDISKVLALEEELISKEESIETSNKEAKKTFEKADILKTQVEKELEIIIQQKVDGQEKIDKEILILKSKQIEADNIVTENKAFKETLDLKARSLRLREVKLEDRERTHEYHTHN